MNRGDIVLAMLASADGRTFSPVQIQKAIFLVSRNLPSIFDEGEEFSPDYSPGVTGMGQAADTM